MYSKETELYKKRLKLTSRQKQILVGSLLGDAHIEIPYRPNVGRLKIEHSYKQKDYVDWLYNEFKEWVRTPPNKRTKTSWDKKQINYCFTTYTHNELGVFAQRFYKNKLKIIPKNLETDLTPLSLAIWYMDDGSVKSSRHKGIFLNTQAFSLRDIGRLQQVLKKRFSIDSSTRKDKNGMQIYISSNSAERFIGAIKPYVIISMVYKIPKILR